MKKNLKSVKNSAQKMILNLVFLFHSTVGWHGGDCDECEVYLPERNEGGIHTSYIATMSLNVHTTFCVQIGGKSRIACERVVSRGQSSFMRYEHFARWSGRYEHFAGLRRRCAIGCMQLYAQVFNASVSARLDTKLIKAHIFLV